MKKLTRRQFLTSGGLGLMALGAWPKWLAAASAQATRAKRKVFVVLFQRGAADGLNMVPPFHDPAYRRARPSIGMDAATRRAPQGSIDLDGRFGLHPALADLVPLWKDGRLAIVQAAGSPNGTRSHFDAQDYMESGTPGVKTTEDGWLNRAMMTGASREPLAAVAVAARLPLTLRGDYPAVATTNIDQLARGLPLSGSFEDMYDDSVDALLSGAAHDVRAARQALANIPRFDAAVFERAGYPKGPLGRELHELARLIAADVGLRVGFVEVGGWDTHQNEGPRLTRCLHDLGGCLAAFYRELGDRSEDVLLVTMTEFGRTMQENGDGGTDHGHASVMMVLGGGVRGGKVYGRWPGLAPEQLFEGRDLQVTTDYRQVLSEALVRHSGVRKLDAVFPGGSFPAIGLLG